MGDRKLAMRCGCGEHKCHGQGWGTGGVMSDVPAGCGWGGQNQEPRQSVNRGVVGVLGKVWGST